MADDGLVAALARAQTAMSHPKKTKTNPHFKSDYADLADVLNAVRPALNAEGIAVVQTVEDGDLVTELWKGHEFLRSRLPLNLDVKPQELGSQLSYLRRYALSAITGVASEADDDGNAAQTAPARTQTPVTVVTEDGRRYSIERSGEPVDSNALAAATPPDKPIAAMTVAELIRYARDIGVPVSGSKSDMVRTLEPYVLAATGEEPWDMGSGEGEGGQANAPAPENTPANPSPSPDSIPFNPKVAERLLPPDARKSVRSQ
jgi:hypothetical protein